MNATIMKAMDILEEFMTETNTSLLANETSSLPRFWTTSTTCTCRRVCTASFCHACVQLSQCQHTSSDFVRTRVQLSRKHGAAHFLVACCLHAVAPSPGTASRGPRENHEGPGQRPVDQISTTVIDLAQCSGTTRPVHYCRSALNGILVSLPLVLQGRTDFYAAYRVHEQWLRDNVHREASKSSKQASAWEYLESHNYKKLES